MADVKQEHQESVMSEAELRKALRERQEERIAECRRLVAEAEQKTRVRLLAQPIAGQPQVGQPLAVGAQILYLPVELEPEEGEEAGPPAG